MYCEDKKVRKLRVSGTLRAPTMYMVTDSRQHEQEQEAGLDVAEKFFGEIWALDEKRLEWAVVVVGGKAQGVVVVYGNQR